MPPRLPPPKGKPTGKPFQPRPPKPIPPPASEPDDLPLAPDELRPEFVPFSFAEKAADDRTHEAEYAEAILKIGSVLAARRRESLPLYSPLPTQEEFHKTRCRVRLLPGSNRGGKTLAAAVEVARAVTGCDPHGKHPAEGVAVAVGGDYDHVGKVMFPMLFEPGAFKVIRDKETRMLRAFRPWDAADLARKSEARKAPPLVPKRMIQSITWHQKAKKIPVSVTLTTGWVLNFYSGKAEPPQGMDFDLAWLDEEIPGNWYNELSARITAKSGQMVWSATPQHGTAVFFDLCERAEYTAELPIRHITQFKIRLSDNPHVSEADKQALAESYTDETERRVRVDGEFALDTYRVFPEYSRVAHAYAGPEVIPASWTRYAIIDPGRKVCAVLFAAVPDPVDVNPREYDLVLYDELYLRNCSAVKFGVAMRDACAGQIFEDFVIDTHGARVHEIGSGKRVYDQYADQMKRHGIKSLKSKSEFSWSKDDVKSGISLARSYLETRETGFPRVRVARARMKNFEYEIDRYRWRISAGSPSEEPDEVNKPTHLMAGFRYLVMHRPRFVPPDPNRGEVENPLVRAYLSGKNRLRRSGPTVTIFGPARSMA